MPPTELLERDEQLATLRAGLTPADLEAFLHALATQLHPVEGAATGP